MPLGRNKIFENLDAFVFEFQTFSVQAEFV
eukprot:SAG11_NODE_1446_length_4891_cov_1.703673_5_plen_29_part_01